MTNVNSSTLSNTSLDVSSITSALTKSLDVKIEKNIQEQKANQVKISQAGAVISKVSDLSDKMKAVDSSTDSVDSTVLKNNIKAIVSDYNSLKGERSVRDLNYKARAGMDTVELKKMGLSFDKTGKMNFNEADFDTNISNNKTDVVNAANKGFDNILSKPEVFTNLTDSTYGSLNMQSNRYEKRIVELQNQQEKINLQKTNISQSYTMQLNNLQNYLNNMNFKQNSINNLLGKG